MSPSLRLTVAQRRLYSVADSDSARARSHESLPWIMISINAGAGGPPAGHDAVAVTAR